MAAGPSSLPNGPADAPTSLFCTHNLQEIGVDDIQVHTFMPVIQQCFGHLSSTLHSLPQKSPGALADISCTSLDSSRTSSSATLAPWMKTADAELIPSSVPSLRGRLTFTCFTRENLVKDVITVFGGLSFRYMDLFRVKCALQLLDACAETLETLRLYPIGVRSEGFLTMREGNGLNQAIHSRRPGAPALRSVPSDARDCGEVDQCPGHRIQFLRTVLSTVTPPTLLSSIGRQTLAASEVVGSNEVWIPFVSATDRQMEEAQTPSVTNNNTNRSAKCTTHRTLGWCSPRSRTFLIA